MSFLPRFYENIDDYLSPGKVLVIYGPRQVGKTTLLQNYLSKTSFKYKLDSGDNITTQQILSSQDFKKISEYLAGYELYALDEASHIANVGQALKIIVDQNPKISVIATGSSSFELSGQVGEPLTGRKQTLILYPLSQIELGKLHDSFELKEKIPEWLIFGGYPEVVSSASKERKITILNEITNSYLLKDILTLEKVKGSKTLLDLLRLLSFQVGSEVSLTELGRQLGLDYKTVARYLDLFEKSFVLFNLRGYARNLRKEVSKKSKYYFYDNGIRNAIISNYNELDLRDDIGKLWENFLVSERLKAQAYKKIYSNNYFWRTWDKKEIDWIEEREGKLFGYEFKWQKEKIKAPKDWFKTYNNASFEVIMRDSYLEFVS